MTPRAGIAGVTGLIGSNPNTGLGVTKRHVRSIEQQAHELLSQHPHFRGRAGNFEFAYCDDVLIVRGRVPTYYLKQMLQTVLKDVSGVTHIDNWVDVLSSDGVESLKRQAGGSAHDVNSIEHP